MKIEKISDTQIRCTLNREDLVSHEIKLSELACGSEKAKLLFRDMIEQAKASFGFEADNYPLMIEAIPVSADCIILIITKVENPEDIDSRFSGFEPPDGGDEPDDGFIPMSETLENIKNRKDEGALDSPHPIGVVFSFRKWEEASSAASACTAPARFKSVLYKRKKDGLYLLNVVTEDEDDTEFVRLCNLLSEYGQKEKSNSSTFAYLNEHCDTIIKDSALTILAQY